MTRPLSRVEVDALRDALAWRRDQLSRVDHDAADDVLALRAWMTLDDMLAATAVFGDEAPLTLNREQAHDALRARRVLRHRSATSRATRRSRSASASRPCAR